MALAAGRLHTLLVINLSAFLVCKGYPAPQTVLSRVRGVSLSEVSDRVGFSTASTQKTEGQGSASRVSGASCRLNKA